MNDIDDDRHNVMCSEQSQNPDANSCLSLAHTASTKFFLSLSLFFLAKLKEFTIFSKEKKNESISPCFFFSFFFFCLLVLNLHRSLISFIYKAVFVFCIFQSPNRA
uniref:Uncharacterized protein n=1 Tax=Micrurus surinamensis TaxID=129470 RepID=A0A2D4PGI7_MICSU